MADTSETGDVLSFFADLVRCETRLYNLLDERLRRAHEIVTSQYEFLRYIRDHENCRVADLANEFAVGVGATSKGIDRLEARGYVTRRPNPRDRRSMVLVLTNEGASLVGKAERLVRDQLTDLLDRTDGSLDAAARTLRELRHVLEADRLGMPVG